MMIVLCDVEDVIVWIIQKVCVVGIYLVLVIQCLLVDVVIGLIKINVLLWLVFVILLLIDSWVILDQVGVEKLIGMGDGLFLLMGVSKFFWLQGVYVFDEEIYVVVIVCKEQVEFEYIEGVIMVKFIVECIDVDFDIGDDMDVFLQVVELVVFSQFGLMLMLQCKLWVGFVKVGCLMDLMEICGIVGFSEGLKVCEVLVKFDELVGILVVIWGDGGEQFVEQM